MARILITVGMSHRPFDRLVHAAVPLCAYHDVFMQTGTATEVPPCPHARWVPLDELQRRLAEADIVVTHAGATVRLAQRLGAVPIVVPRLCAHGEAEDDARSGWLQAEAATGRVVAVWDADRLPDAVATHAVMARRLRRRPLKDPVPDDTIVSVLDEVCARIIRP